MTVSLRAVYVVIHFQPGGHLKTKQRLFDVCLIIAGSQSALGNETGYDAVTPSCFHEFNYSAVPISCVFELNICQVMPS